MSYYFSTVVKNKSFEEVLESVKSELAKQGFGVVSDLDMQATFKQKLNADFRKYRILGACSPAFARQAIENERNIGVLLPCSVVVQEKENSEVEVAAIDPLTAMIPVENTAVQEVATEIAQRLEKAIENLG
jgi:uncharacterized protein (DUF302 family)